MEKNDFGCRAAGISRLFIMVSVFLCASIYRVDAQSFSVSGTVTGAGGGNEIGVVVFVKGDQSNGTMTDEDGRYSIDVPDNGSVLVFSLLGYKTMEVPVAGRSVVNVQLEEESTVLDEVLVVGYGMQKRQFVVGSVSQVSSKELLKAPQANVQNMLAGKLSGLTTVQKTGTPGDDSSQLLVRGRSTFNGSSPLILVDGVERQMQYLNPNDIASISILKDAATAAIYGVKAANGVILITTKTGTEGRSTVSYDGSVSFDTNTVVPEMLNAEDYIYWHNKAMEMDGATPYWTDDVLARLDEMGILGETDWLDKVYDKFGFTHQHNISASGGTDKIRYFASVGYMNQDGILKNTSFERYNFRANIDARLTGGLRFMINVSGAHSARDWPGLSMASQYEFNPIQRAFYSLPIFKETYNGLPLGYKPGSYTYNPVASLNSGYQQQKRWMAEVRSSLEYDFASATPALQGLKASVFFAYNYGQTMDHNLLESYQQYSYSPTTQTLTLTTSEGISETGFNKSQSVGWDYTIRPQISYEREFAEKHHVSALMLFESYKSYSDTMTGFKKGYYSGYPVDISLGFENQSPYVTGSHEYKGSASFAGRFGYAYDRKYIVEATFRVDGSYKFAPENRWGFFPSVALGWVMSEERFFKDNVSWMDYFKLRASVGRLGSDDTDPYLYIRTYATAQNSYVTDGLAQQVFYSNGYVYDNLTWSTTNTYNVGLEMRAFRNRLSFEFDWFYKFTDRILENEGSSSTYAPSLGGNYPIWVNSGQMDNRGFDMTVGWTDSFANGWSYGLTGMLSWSRNRVLNRKIADDHPEYRAVLGQPLDQLYGFEATGLFQTQEQIDNYTTAPTGTLNLGDIMYRDVNGDGIISSQYDYVRIGYAPTPEMVFSLNMEVGWKNIMLSALWQGAALCNYSLTGVYGNGNCDNTMYSRPFYSNGNAPYYLVENSWTPENTDARYPRLSAGANGNNAWSSSWWVVDGSYLRLKNLQLSYTLPARVLKNRMQRIMIYVAGTNLLTFTEFKYLDPENPGLNNGYYPQQSTYSIGLNLTF